MLVLAGGLGIGWYNLKQMRFEAAEALDRYAFASAARTRVFDRDGEVIVDLSPARGSRLENIKLDEMPNHLWQSFVAAEDQAFFSHSGISYRGVLRAMWVNLKNGRFLQGGSTITQQLVKFYVTGPKRSLTRKLKESLVALALESRADKKEILEHYLNSIFFGNRCYGVSCAADLYFGKKAESLTLGESATLAAMVKAPSRMNPFHNSGREKLQQRRRYVLKRMFEDRYISAEDAWKSHKSVRYKKRSLTRRSQLSSFVKSMLHGRETAQQRSFVKTSLSLKEQKLLSNGLRKLPLNSDLELAAILIEPIRASYIAMTGSWHSDQAAYNRAVYSDRPIGGLVSFFIKALALEKGVIDRSLFGGQSAGSAAPESELLETRSWAHGLGLVTIAEFWKRHRLGEIPNDFSFLQGKNSLTLEQLTLITRNLLYKGAVGKLSLLPAEAQYKQRSVFSAATRVALNQSIASRNDSCLNVATSDQKNAWLVCPRNDRLLTLWIGSEKGQGIVDAKLRVKVGRFAKRFLQRSSLAKSDHKNDADSPSIVY